MPPSVQEQLNERQTKTMAEILKKGFVTSGWCQRHFNIVKDTANRDLTGLVQLGLIKAVGKGRGTRYVLKSATK